MVLCTSESPPLSPSILAPPIESTSSINMIAGALNTITIISFQREIKSELLSGHHEQFSDHSCSFSDIFLYKFWAWYSNKTAILNSYNALGFIFRSNEFVTVWWATALANSVFPVPGGPYNNTPLG